VSPLIRDNSRKDFFRIVSLIEVSSRKTFKEPSQLRFSQDPYYIPLQYSSHAFIDTDLDMRVKGSQDREDNSVVLPCLGQSTHWREGMGVMVTSMTIYVQGTREVIRLGGESSMSNKILGRRLTINEILGKKIKHRILIKERSRLTVILYRYQRSFRHESQGVSHTEKVTVDILYGR
jgi:hypothetical protein